MNEELRGLFNCLPEGVVLLAAEGKQVSLANTEFKRLFHCADADDSRVEARVREARLRKHVTEAAEEEGAAL